MHFASPHPDLVSRSDSRENEDIRGFRLSPGSAVGVTRSVMAWHGMSCRSRSRARPRRAFCGGGLVDSMPFRLFGLFVLDLVLVARLHGDERLLGWLVGLVALERLSR
jgi:hypothetical protein